MIKFIFSCLLLSAVSLSVSGAAPKPLIRLSANQWEPFVGAALPQQGVATDIVVTALRRAGYATEITLVPWSRALSQTYYGKVDGVVGVWPTAQRKDRLVFSESYLENALYLVYLRPELSAKTSIDTLDGVRIGVGRDYDYSDGFLQGKKYQLEPVDRITQNLSKLHVGRIDMMLEDRHAVEYTIRHHADDYAKLPKLKYSADPLLKLPLHFGMRLDHPQAEEIVAAFNLQLKAMRKDGTLAAILRRLDQPVTSPAGGKSPR